MIPSDGSGWCSDGFVFFARNVRRRLSVTMRSQLDLRYMQKGLKLISQL